MFIIKVLIIMQVRGTALISNIWVENQYFVFGEGIHHFDKIVLKFMISTCYKHPTMTFLIFFRIPVLPPASNLCWILFAMCPFICAETPLRFPLERICYLLKVHISLTNGIRIYWAAVLNLFCVCSFMFITWNATVTLFIFMNSHISHSGTWWLYMHLFIYLFWEWNLL